MSENWVKEWAEELFEKLVEDGGVIQESAHAGREGPKVIEAFLREQYGLAEANSILQDEEEEEDV